MTNRFFEFFPPPNFLTMPAVGLSIECDAIRIVSFGEKHGHHALKVVDEIVLESGVIVAGDPTKPEKILQAFEKIRSKHGVHFARISLPEENAYRYEAVIPMPEDGEIRDAVEFSLDQNIPITAAEAVFDFAVIEGPFLHNDVSSVRVVVSAYPKDKVETWVDLLKQAGITAIAVLSESQAVGRSVILKDDKKTFLLVHFLKDKTVIAIMSEGFVRFATTVANSGDSIEATAKSHEGERIVESVELLAVRDEVKKVYTFWMSKGGIKTRKDRGGFKSLVVSGHVADMADIAEYLGKHVGLPATLGNVWQNAFSLTDFVPELPFEDSLKFAAAVGAAVR